MNARVPAGTTPASFDVLKAESFIRGESMLAVIIDEPMQVVCERLERVAVASGHEVLAVHDIAATLHAGSESAGLGLRVYDIGRPGVLAQVVAADPAMAHAMPCRIVVHDANGVTTITTPRPAVAWPELSHAPAIARLARQVEVGLQRLLRGLQ